MATHSSILAWKIPWTEVLGGSVSMRLPRAGHNWETQHTLCVLIMSGIIHNFITLNLGYTSILSLHVIFYLMLCLAIEDLWGYVV